MLHAVVTKPCSGDVCSASRHGKVPMWNPSQGPALLAQITQVWETCPLLLSIIELSLLTALTCMSHLLDI